MTDSMTRESLSVSTDGTAGPYIMVSVDQLDELRKLLTEHQIPHRVQEDVMSLNGSPMMAVVDLGRRADAPAVQAILNGVH